MPFLFEFRLWAEDAVIKKKMDILMGIIEPPTWDINTGKEKGKQGPKSPKPLNLSLTTPKIDIDSGSNGSPIS